MKTFKFIIKKGENIHNFCVEDISDDYLNDMLFFKDINLSTEDGTPAIDPFMRDQDGNNLMHVALYYFDIYFVNALSIIAPELSVELNNKGESPLYIIQNYFIYSEEARLINYLEKGDFLAEKFNLIRNIQQKVIDSGKFTNADYDLLEGMLTHTYQESPLISKSENITSSEIGILGEA